MENEIVTVVSVLGEVVGRLKSMNDNELVIEDARMFVQTQEGAGFAPGICLTGDSTKEVTVNRSAVFAVVKANEQASAAWRQQTSGIIT